MTNCKDCKYWRYTEEQASEVMHECAKLTEGSEDQFRLETQDAGWPIQVLTSANFGCELGEQIDMTEWSKRSAVMAKRTTRILPL